MFQDSIRLLVHPNKETILDIIQSVTFKGAICLYTLAWVILRIIMGNAGIDVLHILPILDHNVNVNIRMYNFDDVQCTVIPPVAYGFVTGMNLQLC